MKIGPGSEVSFLEWTSLTFLSMMAIMFLPRQFHVAVVENYSADHIKKALWLFPLYLFLINIFVLPIAYGGLLLNDIPSTADYFVLSIPMHYGHQLLAIIAFIGGFSAATAMIIVESVALSTMVTNSFVVPTLWDLSAIRNFHAVILNIKRLVIIGCVLLGYPFAVSIGEFYSLVDIGLKSFEAVTIFAPSILLGLYWKGGNKKGAMAGIVAGFAVWIYTLLIPALMRAGIIEPGGMMEAVFNSRLLNPTALFGLQGLDRWSHSLFWGMLLNVGFYVGVSLFQPASPMPRCARRSSSWIPIRRSSSLTPSGRSPLARSRTSSGSTSGRARRAKRLTVSSRGTGWSRESVPAEWLLKLRQEAERLLSGALGPTISTLVFQERAVLTHEDAVARFELDPPDIPQPDAVPAGTGRGEPAARHAEGVQREHHRKSSPGRCHPGRVAAGEVLEQRHGDDHRRGEVRRAEQRGRRLSSPASSRGSLPRSCTKARSPADATSIRRSS